MQSSTLFEKLQRASRKEIVAQIDDHLTQPHHAPHAQLLIQELAAREQRLQSIIMVICPVVIAVLTAVITSRQYGPTRASNAFSKGAFSIAAVLICRFRAANQNEAKIFHQKEISLLGTEMEMER